MKRGLKPGNLNMMLEMSAAYYVIKGGDTGNRIARSIGVSLDEIQAANPSLDWSRLRVGQRIKIPSDGHTEEIQGGH
jgi:LysM repeat protein